MIVRVVLGTLVGVARRKQTNVPPILVLTGHAMTWLLTIGKIFEVCQEVTGCYLYNYYPSKY